MQVSNDKFIPKDEDTPDDVSDDDVSEDDVEAAELSDKQPTSEWTRQDAVDE